MYVLKVRTTFVEIEISYLYSATSLTLRNFCDFNINWSIKFKNRSF